jgi:hypothetical protein
MSFDCTAGLLVDSTFVIPPSNFNFYWTVCAVDPITLDPVYDPEFQFGYSINHFFSALPLTTINLGNKSFNTVLFPSCSVHPKEASKDTSMQVYMTGLPYPGGGVVYGRRVQIDNYANLYDGVSGILSGYWFHTLSTVLVPGTDGATNVSGLIEYDTGNLWVDFHNVDSISAGFTEDPTVFVKYRATYHTPDKGAELRTIAAYVTNAEVRLDVLNNDTKVILVSCDALKAWNLGFGNIPVTSQAQYLYPPSMSVQDSYFNYTTVALSAVEKRGDNYRRHPLSASENVWPTDFYYGRAIAWRGTSESNTNPVDMKLSAIYFNNAIFPLPAPVIVDLSNNTVSGW